MNTQTGVTRTPYDTEELLRLALLPQNEHVCETITGQSASKIWEALELYYGYDEIHYEDYEDLVKIHGNDRVMLVTYDGWLPAKIEAAAN